MLLPQWVYVPEEEIEKNEESRISKISEEMILGLKEEQGKSVLQGEASQKQRSGESGM